jgi:hypothetical protein
VRRFPARRHADLWAGVGLAAAFAGGADARDLALLRRASGEHAAQLALGAVFAAVARTSAGVVPAHTGTATAAFGDVTVAQAVRLAEATAVGEDAATADAPAYEVWRSSIRERLDVGRTRAA